MPEGPGNLHTRSSTGDVGTKLAMNIGLFGGTFDPVHRGHVALAHAAVERCRLQRVHFVAANVPPHKQKQSLTPFLQRFAMLALATQNEKVFVPSVLEAPADGESRKNDRPNYTIDTVRRLRQSCKSGDRIFLVIGMDAFAEIANWHQAEALFRECEFIVAGRPGYSLADVANALPDKLRPRPEVTKPFHNQVASGDLLLRGVTIHLLEDLRQPASATAIREAAKSGKPLGRFLDPAVAAYIKKAGLYK